MRSLSQQIEARGQAWEWTNKCVDTHRMALVDHERGERELGGAGGKDIRWF